MSNMTDNKNKLTAAQAREITESTTVDILLKEIQIAARNGRSSITETGVLKEAHLKELEELGYKVDSVAFVTAYTIRW